MRKHWHTQPIGYEWLKIFFNELIDLKKNGRKGQIRSNT